MTQTTGTAPVTTLSADTVAAIAYEVRALLERYELAPLRAKVEGLRREVRALRAEHLRQRLADVPEPDPEAVAALTRLLRA